MRRILVRKILVWIPITILLLVTTFIYVNLITMPVPLGGCTPSLSVQQFTELTLNNVKIDDRLEEKNKRTISRSLTSSRQFMNFITRNPKYFLKYEGDYTIIGNNNENNELLHIIFTMPDNTGNLFLKDLYVNGIKLDKKEAHIYFQKLCDKAISLKDKEEYIAKL